MAVHFPDIPQTVDPAETQVNYSFDHLIACINQGRAPGELWYPRAVAIDSNNNQIYVAEGLFLWEGNPYNIARVSIFSETGEFLNIFSHPDMKWPWGIAIHRDSVYVTDIERHSIFHFKAEADFLLAARIGDRGSVIGQFDEPRQLTVSTNGDIFVADFCNNRIQIFDSNLHYQRHISHHSLRKPLDVKLTPEEVFVLCETSPCIIVFSLTGDLTRSLILHSDIGMQDCNPSFFCLDANCNLLLSDRLNLQTRIFSKEGTLLYTFGQFGHKVGISLLPQGIAITNNLKLVIVSRNIYYSLQIYSSD